MATPIVLISMVIVNGGFADAPDLGFQNRRFRSIPFRFKNRSIYERKRDSSRLASLSRPASKMFVILAQFLVREFAMSF
jgi:hypothetical protein